MLISRDMKIRRIALLMVASIMLVSCGASRKVAKKPVETYVQPGSELVNVPDALRAWAMGISDSEMTARKKAMTAASAQLAQMLNSAVKNTVEEYCVTLSEGEQARSKEYLNSKTDIVSEKLLVGAKVIFDQWEPKDADGMYRNYIVLELSNDDFIKTLLESMKDAQSVDVKVDEDLLDRLFRKAVSAGR